MKPPPFEYEAPTTVQEVVALLQHDDDHGSGLQRLPGLVGRSPVDAQLGLAVALFGPGVVAGRVQLGLRRFGDLLHGGAKGCEVPGCPHLRAVVIAVERSHVALSGQ